MLLDFWTYSCINCIRTLPYLKAWDQKYRQQGPVIIGIHSPEFAFEREINNVKAAINEYEITYPVAIDNHFATWDAYHNRYWPAHYLINQNGYVVYTHFGEGQYQETEQNIVNLLALNKQAISRNETNGYHSRSQTPETYLGYKRMVYFGHEGAIPKNQNYEFEYPIKLSLHFWGLSGQWNIQKQHLTSTVPGAKLKKHFFAKNVFLVMGSKNNTPIQAKLYLDNKPLKFGAGPDVDGGLISVNQHKLYHLVDLPQAGPPCFRNRVSHT